MVTEYSWQVRSKLTYGARGHPPERYSGSDVDCKAVSQVELQWLFWRPHRLASDLRTLLAEQRASLRYVVKSLLKRQPVQWTNSGCFPPSDGQLGCRDGPRMVVSLAACLELCQRKMTTLTGIFEGTSCPSRYSLAGFPPGVRVCLPLKPCRQELRAKTHVSPQGLHL